MKITLFSCLILIIFSSLAIGQPIQNDVITTSGSLVSNDQNMVSWTIGETIIETYNNSGSIVTQGFQQVYFSFTEILEIKEANFTVNVFPNPAIDFVNIDIQSEDLNGTYNIEINSLNGQLIHKQSYHLSNTLRIDLRSVKAELVILKVTHKETGSQRVFKIVKSNK